MSLVRGNCKSICNYYKLWKAVPK